MTSPNEPRIPDAPNLPPWQRGASHPEHHSPSDPHTEPRLPGSRSADARLSRFISGASASAAGSSAHAKIQQLESDNRPAHNESPLPEAYASELPDLSRSSPRAPQRKLQPDRLSGGSGVSGVGRLAVSETLEPHVRVSRRVHGGPVRASMQIRRIDPWSALKVSLLLSVVLFFVWMISVAFLYLLLGGIGVWAKLNSNVGDLLNNTSGSSGELVSSSAIFGGAALIGLVNIVLMTAMATVAVFIYNLTTDLIGGIEVTLADRD